MSRRLWAVLVLLLGCVSLAAARDIAVVANKSTPVSAVTVADLVKICKAQTNHWPDGKPVTFIMRAPSVPAMKMVLEKVYGMPEGEVNGLIVAANHARGGSRPAILLASSDEDLVNKVASIPGALGVVDVYSINSSV